MRRSIGAILSLLLIGLFAAPAHADTTHPFLGYITIPNGTNPQPAGVDHEGNLIVWLNDQKAVAKYDVNGNPVNFTGLGTNIIDGKGGFDCPSTPADCDRVPTEGFRGTDSHNELVQSGTVLAIDNSGGPADGYIYVENNEAPGVSPGAYPHGEIDVFDGSGVFKGTINQAQAFPKGGDVDAENQGPNGALYFFSQGISVDPDGVLYVLKAQHLPQTINRYTPIDGDPAHTLFSGQTRTNCYIASCQEPLQHYGGRGIAAGRNFVYAQGYDRSHSLNGGSVSRYMRYPIKEFFRRGLTNYAVTEDYRPSVGPFENADLPFGNYFLEVFTIDPVNEHVYLAHGDAGLQEWDANNNQVGPMFGSEGCPGYPNDPPTECHVAETSSLDMIGLDRSGGPTDGRVYVKGPAANQIAVFGAPVKIPDINDVSATAAHTTAHVSAEVALAGGPDATDCDVEYGPTLAYEYSVPCDAPPPYTTDTKVDVDLSGLVVGGDYHYRVMVKTANGNNASHDREFETKAVLSVSTEDATDLDTTSASLNGSLDPDGIATDYFFDFGISSEYSQKTPESHDGRGNRNHPRDTSEYLGPSGGACLSLPPGRAQRSWDDKRGRSHTPRSEQPSDHRRAHHGRDRCLGRSPGGGQSGRVRHQLPVRIRKEPGLRGISTERRRRRRLGTSAGRRAAQRAAGGHRLSLPSRRDKQMGNDEVARHDLHLPPADLPQLPRAAADPRQLSP